MPNNVFLAALAADVVFLATGCVELGFSLIVRSQMFNEPTNGEMAVRNLIYQTFPLTAGIVNGAFIIAASFFTLVGLLSPMRTWLKSGGYLVAVCGVFTLCVGVYLWIMTLNLKASFAPIYLAQDTSVHDLIQTSFECCGYFNSSSPAFVTDSTCPSPAAAALLRGCSSAISTFANTLIDTVFTALFGMTGIAAILILAIACLLKDRKERERYRHIDQKSGYMQF
ncbi:hypothetical protein CDD82_2333 [Ophiocordyceps australis]|uniref:Tetraspanin n=1 Tax=Ophiocordyceps australis TaxID=1399860 RepID=A0A2C5XEZ8_9HYPO|nr:hypothetical protein CDD82_2333 [Ophiocordyceps australis]